MTHETPWHDAAGHNDLTIWAAYAGDDRAAVNTNSRALPLAAVMAGATDGTRSLGPRTRLVSAGIERAGSDAAAHLERSVAFVEQVGPLSSPGSRGTLLNAALRGLGSGMVGRLRMPVRACA